MPSPFAPVNFFSSSCQFATNLSSSVAIRRAVSFAHPSLPGSVGCSGVPILWQAPPPTSMGFFMPPTNACWPNCCSFFHLRSFSLFVSSLPLTTPLGLASSSPSSDCLLRLDPDLLHLSLICSFLLSVAPSSRRPAISSSSPLGSTVSPPSGAPARSP